MKQHIRIQNHPKTARIYKPVENVLELLAHAEEHEDRTVFLWNGKTKKDPDESMTYGEFTEIVKLAKGVPHLSPSVDKNGQYLGVGA